MSDAITIGTERSWSWKKFFFQWEWLLVLVLLLVVFVNSILSPYFLSFSTMLNAPTTFLDKAFIVFPMMLVIILGRIDISVGSNVALSAVIMAVAYNAGLPMPLAVLLCLVVGTLGGAINGLLMIRFKELSFVIVTLSTMIIYRGIAYIILGDQSSGGFPEWFSFLGWGSILGIPFILVCFFITALIFGLLLHKTSFGRVVYGMGFNMKTCRYSGIKVDRVVMLVFTLAGLMSAVSAIFLTSRMGSTRPNVAQGYELEVIAMVALGGVSTSGGIGRIGGPILAVFIIGYLSYGMGLANIQAPVVLVGIGTLLILSVLAMKVRFSFRGKRKSAI
jgi:rhamnose transport system permease protein